MATVQACIAALMKSPCSMKEKFRMIAAHFCARQQLASALKLPERQLRAAAMRRLFSEANGDQGARQALQAVIDGIARYVRQQKRKPNGFEVAFGGAVPHSLLQNGRRRADDHDDRLHTTLAVHHDRPTHESVQEWPLSTRGPFGNLTGAGKTPAIRRYVQRGMGAPAGNVAAHVWVRVVESMLDSGKTLSDPLRKELAAVLHRFREARKRNLARILAGGARHDRSDGQSGLRGAGKRRDSRTA